MRSPDNPFRLPHSEAITSDLTFLRLFGPSILEALPDQDQWRQFRIFRSAAGGGKTSLLRLFSPSCLLRLYENRGTDDLRELFKKLKNLGVFEDDGPKLLGIFLSGVASYSSIEDLSIVESLKLRLFNSMVDARIAIGALIGVVELAGLKWPDDLHRISIEFSPGSSGTIPIGSDGKQLLDWAQGTELKIWSAIDSFSSPHVQAEIGHESIHMLNALSPSSIKVDGKEIVNHCVVMIDESWRLGQRQQQALKTHVLTTRPAIGLWLAERFEALDDKELFAGSNLIDRNVNPVVYLDSFWRNRKVFEDAANKRVRLAPNGTTTFADILGTAIDSSKYDHAFARAAQSSRNRMQALSKGALKYKTFLSRPLEADLSKREEAIELRSREILLERDSRKSQLSFDLDAGSEIDEKSTSDVRPMAEFFLCSETGTPYYYGMERLSDLASHNVHQFMFLATELFEEVLSRSVTSESQVLQPQDQERLLRRAASDKLSETLRSVSRRPAFRDFLRAFSEFAKMETTKPNAPYGAVTGFSITTEDHERLVRARSTRDSSGHKELADLLAACLVQNIFSAVTDRKQGKVGKTWTIFYLNRLLCLEMNLPLAYGGYRSKTLTELDKWMRLGRVTGTEDQELPYEDE